MKNICASCKSVNVKSIIKTDNNKLPKWLQKTDYVSKFIEKTPLKLYKKGKSNMKLKLNVGLKNKNKLMLYWGAKSSNSILVKDAKKAYGNFSNYGVCKVNNDGIATLFFDCPQPYSTIEKGSTKRESFYRHLHFCFSNYNKSSWLETVYTKIIICDLNLKQTLDLQKKQSIILINALPNKYYSKSHIQNSWNLPVKELKKMTQNELLNWFAEVISLNNTKLYNLIKSKKINLYEIPIVVYCANEKCNAGYLAAIELLKKGFINISDFKGGMKEYLKLKKKH